MKFLTKDRDGLLNYLKSVSSIRAELRQGKIDTNMSEMVDKLAVENSELKVRELNLN